MSENITSRKDFLKKMCLGLLGLPLLANEQACNNQSSFPNNGNTNQAPQSDKNCTDITNTTTEGPFYVTNVPESININDKNLPGIPMIVTGIVYGSNKTPLKKAKVEIWHADSNGIYYPQGNGDVSRYAPSQITLRGTTFTDSQGRFSFNSIRPGLYTGRRRHIHWRISEANHDDVITQTYWLSEKGDEREQIDATDRNTDICRYINFKNTGSGITGNIEFYLGT